MFSIQKSGLVIFFAFLVTGCGLPSGPNVAPNFATISAHPVILTPNTTIDAINPQIALDSSNRIFVTWQDNIGNINYSYSTDGGSTFQNPSSFAIGSYPRIATDGNNNAYIVNYSNGSFFLNYALSNKFQTSIQISTVTDFSFQNPEPRADLTFGSGTLFITWSQSYTGCSGACKYYDVLYNTSVLLNPLTLGTTPVTVLHDTFFAGYPKTVQSGGNPSIVYFETSATDLVLSRFITTTQSNFSVNTQNANAQPPLSSSLGVDGNGNSYVAWEATNPKLNGVDIYFNTLKKTSSLFNSIPINLSNNGVSKGPVVGIDSSQYVYVAFFSRSSIAPNLYDVFLERSADGGKSFTGAMNISNTPGDSASYAPGMAILGKTAYVVWDDNSATGGNHQIYFQKITLN